MTNDSKPCCDAAARFRSAARRILQRAAAGLALLAFAAGACAHKSSDAYLQLTRDAARTTLRVDVALRDLDAALDLDADADGKLVWGEVRRAWPAIGRYVWSRVSVAGCDFVAAGPALEQRADGVYAALVGDAACAPDAGAAVRYTLLAEVDPTHRGILRLDLPGRPAQVRVLDPTAAPSAAEPPPSFVAEGIGHIVGGLDHVLFLLCLLLPAAMRRGSAGWRPVGLLREAVLPVAAIVTSFTLAHSITLALAATGRIALPPAVIEPAIAITIVLAALDNLYPLFRGRRVAVTFLFGLIHGFGFAGVLAELDLPAAQFAWALFRFNVGLELGQIAVVALAAVPLYLARGWRRYPSWGIGAGSLAAAIVGTMWFVERSGVLN